MSWDLREALLSYEKSLRDDAIEEYRFNVLLYQIRGPWVKEREKPPVIPDILRG